MSTVNNATGVYKTLGYNFSDPNDDVIVLSANTQAHLNSMPAIIETWQAQEIANNTIGGYYQNPVAGNTYAIITIAQQMVISANTGVSQNIANCELVLTAANGLYNNASSFLGHTNRISNVVPINSQYDYLPYYEPAMAFGKIALYIVNQTDAITNTSPILGSFTSLFIGPEIDSANTVLANDLIILNNGVTANNLSESQISQILSDISNTNTILTTRQNSDVTYYNNLRNFVNNYNTVKKFTNLGETETYLINNFVGTEKIVSAISGGTRDAAANAVIANTASYGNLPNPPDPAYQQANNAYFQANTATGIASAAYAFANTLSGGAAIDNVARVDAQAAYNGANTYFANTQNSITYITGVNNTQNTVISLAYARANTSVNTIVGTSGTTTTSNGRIVFQSTNGVTVTGSDTSLTINTPQALRTSDSPTFNNLSLTNPLALAQGGTAATSAAAALTNLLPTGTTAGYVLTTGGPGTYYWAPGGSGGGGGATPGTTINSQRLSYTANGNGFSYTTPTYVPGASQLRVYFDGVRQFASGYTETSATVVTFFSSPPSGTNILIEVDGYINNPYYANNISFTAPFGGISGSANTIQLAIQDLETRKAPLAGPSFTGVALAPSPSVATSNTQIATTGFVHTLVNSGITFSHSITGSASSATTAGSATTASTASTANALNTGNNYRMNSLGVGTDASGTAGEIRATNEVTAYYSSDERLKENIQEIDAALYKLRKVRGVMFDWKDEVIEKRGGEDKYFVRKHDTGIIAQEIEQVLPEVVAVRKDGYKAVRYEKLAGLIIQAINELADEVEEIKQRLK